MRAALVFIALGLLVGVLASLAFGIVGDGAGDAETAELRIEPSGPGGPEGVGSLRHRDGRLTGWIVVWGLEPGSRHAVHFHGPGAQCGTKADPIAIHEDLVADGSGVASFRLDEEAPAGVLEDGVYYNVHAGPSSVSENPEIACGDVRPASA